MIRREITYTDFNDKQQTEEFFFHLSRPEVIELQNSVPGGLEGVMNRIIATKEYLGIVAEMKKLISLSVGRKSPDGKRFIKNDEIRDEFMQSPAYEVLFMELATDASKAAEFVNGFLPANTNENPTGLPATPASMLLPPPAPTNDIGDQFKTPS